MHQVPLLSSLLGEEVETQIGSVTYLGYIASKKDGEDS